MTWVIRNHNLWNSFRLSQGIDVHETCNVYHSFLAKINYTFHHFFSRTLPIGTMSSLFIITTIYMTTNVAYFTVLTPGEILSSNAVALVSNIKKWLF